MEDINLNDLFNNIFDLYDSLRPKYIKRVYRIKGKRKYRKMISYNLLYELLPSPKFLNILLRQMLRSAENE